MNRCVVVSLICGFVVFGACSGPNDSSSPSGTRGPVESAAPAAPKSTVAPAGAPAIVDGTYSKTVIRKEALAAGFDASMVDKLLGPDGEMPLTFKFQGDRWTIFVTDDAGVTETGDTGTQVIDDDGRLVQSSVGSHVITLDWAVDGDTLTLKCAAGANPECVDDAKLVLEGVWVKSQ